MKAFKLNNYLLLLCLSLFFSACEDFVAIEDPNHILTQTRVFEDEVTAQRAMQGIYNELFNSSFANGGNRSVTFLAGCSADNFKPTTNTTEILAFIQNSISPENSWNLDLWVSAYRLIYMVNALLEGIEQSTALSQDFSTQLEGEAKFVRAFSYFYLVNLYGDVPLITTTDYEINRLKVREEQARVMAQLTSDLEDASALLVTDYVNEDRTHPNSYAAMGLLAKVYLTQGNWSQAAYYSEQVISQASRYELLADLDEVFLANSREALWQISPIGWGNSFTHTREGNLFIQDPTTQTPVSLSDDFLASWDSVEDLRYQHWVGVFAQEQQDLFYPYKYKVAYEASGGQIDEYSMVLRLAEQYLIQAEAQAQLGNLTVAATYLNAIRTRAGIPPISETPTALEQSELLNLILVERRKELFAEWGHRWFDLKRTGHTEVLLLKPNTDWQATDSLYPIPEEERLKNPNLTQNNGY